MSFTQAALIVVAVAAVVLGLVCYNLLSRLDMLEQAVHGGLEPPSRRLGREEYEHRFRRALARAELARQVESGIVLALGAEANASDVAGTLANLDRGDGVFLIATHADATESLASNTPAGASILDFDTELGVPVTPYGFVIDNARVTAAAPLPTGADLLAFVERNT